MTKYNTIRKECEINLRFHFLLILLIHCSCCLGVNSPPQNREELFPAFLEWLHKNGVDTSAVEIASFPGFGYGLKTTKDIKVCLLLLSVKNIFLRSGDAKT